MPNPKPPDGYTSWLEYSIAVAFVPNSGDGGQLARAELSSLQDELAALKEENEKLKEILHNQRMESEDDA